LHCRHAAADRLDRIVQLLLAAPGDVDMRPFCDEPLRARQSDALLAPVITAIFPSSLTIASSLVNDGH